jgi:hypothetical protein
MYPGWSNITDANSTDEVHLLEEEARHHKLALVLTDIRDQINEAIAELFSAGMRSIVSDWTVVLCCDNCIESYVYD